MGDIGHWILIGIVWLAIYLGAKRLDKMQDEHESEVSRLRDEINNLRDILAEVALGVERVAYTRDEQARRQFDRLPPLLPKSFESCESGQEFSLLLHPVMSDRIVPVKYRHRELTYRSPNQKDAVAYGEAKLHDVLDELSGKSAEYSEVRILFSRPNETDATATLRGLADEGVVKEGR